MATGYCNVKGRGLKFCQGSISELQKKLAGLDAAKIEAYGGYWLAHFGLEANCIIKGEEITFSFEDTVEWMEGLTGDEIMEIKAAYDATQEFTKDITEPAKKKKMKSE